MTSDRIWQGTQGQENPEAFTFFVSFPALMRILRSRSVGFAQSPITRRMVGVTMYET